MTVKFAHIVLFLAGVEVTVEFACCHYGNTSGCCSLLTHCFKSRWRRKEKKAFKKGAYSSRKNNLDQSAREI